MYEHPYVSMTPPSVKMPTRLPMLEEFANTPNVVLNEDFESNIKKVLADLGSDPESTGFDFDTINSGVTLIGGKPHLVIKNFKFDPKLYIDDQGNPSKEMAAMSIGSFIKDAMVFDPADGELSMSGDDVMFPLKENYSFSDPELQH